MSGILEVIKERGLLLDSEVYELLKGFNDDSLARQFLLEIERISGQKMITTSLLNRNVEYVRSVVSKLDGENKHLVEKTFVNLGLSLEVRRESEIVESEKQQVAGNETGVGNKSMKYKVFYADTKPDKKLEVKDFTNYFRARYNELQRILMKRPELQQNLVSIGKISSERQSLSIIGIVTEKRITKNKNMIIKFEDLTGEINGIARIENQDVFLKAEELQLDDVVGVKGSGNRDMLFVHDIVFPDAFLLEKKQSPIDESVLFLGDLHYGSKLFLEDQFRKFIDYLNGKIPGSGG